MIKLKNSSGFKDAFTIIILIDLLLFPNFPLLIMPISLPIIIGAIVLKKVKISFDKEFLIYLILSLLVLTSVALSFLQTPQYVGTVNIWMENIKRAFQLLTTFAYYFVLKNSIYNKSVNIKKILFIFIWVYIILGIIAYFNVGLYFNVLNILGVSNPFVSDWFLIQQNELFRYSYLFIDPNNAAYVFQIVAFYMLLNESLKPSEKIFLFITIIMSIILSMSAGSALSALIFFLIFVFLQLAKVTTFRISYGNLLKNFFLYFFCIIFIGIMGYFLRDMYSSVAEYSLNRISGNSDGGRLKKYAFMISESLPNLIGEGYVQIRNGLFFRPHSDHLRFLYSYGIVAYLISLWFLFRKAIFNSKFLFVIPGFMAYSINSLIDEQKVLAILLTFIAIAEKRNSINKVNDNLNKDRTNKSIH